MKKPFEIIRDLREDRDLKQKDVADYLKMSRTTYNHYELGHTALNEDIIIKLSKFYNVTPNFILNYKTENEQKLDLLTVKEAKKYMANGEFKEGSMLPKIEACLEYVNHRKSGQAIITSLENAKEALLGKTGTMIVKGG